MVYDDRYVFTSPLRAIQALGGSLFPSIHPAARKLQRGRRRRFGRYTCPSSHLRRHNPSRWTREFGSFPRYQDTIVLIPEVAGGQIRAIKTLGRFLVCAVGLGPRNANGTVTEAKYHRPGVVSCCGSSLKTHRLGLATSPAASAIPDTGRASGSRRERFRRLIRSGSTQGNNIPFSDVFPTERPIKSSPPGD